MKKTLPTVISLALAAWTPAVAAPTADASQSAFKAAMIYNFARFTTWPNARFSDAAAPVVLCVSPGDPLAGDLGRLDGQPVKNRMLDVRTTSNFNSGCHLAYVPEDVSAARLESLNQQGVLTIGDRTGFVRSGAVGLVRIGRQVRFEVNTKAAGQGGVVLSSQLLRLAISVK